MKPVTGSITYSKPFSLSRAARALSKFVAVENGASQAVSSYLKRASSAFNDLVQFHENHRSGKHERSKHKKSRPQSEEQIDGGRVEEEPPPSAVSRGENGVSCNLDEERGDFDDGGRKGSEKRKKKRRELLEEIGGDGAEESEVKEKKKKKKRKKIENEDVLAESNEKVNESKKKRRKRIKEDK